MELCELNSQLSNITASLIKNHSSYIFKTKNINNKNYKLVFSIIYGMMIHKL